MMLANTGPLGLIAFASTTLILSLYNVGARGTSTRSHLSSGPLSFNSHTIPNTTCVIIPEITIPNVVVGQAIAVGGLGQILAGIGDFFVGNVRPQPQPHPRNSLHSRC